MRGKEAGKYSDKGKVKEHIIKKIGKFTFEVEE